MDLKIRNFEKYFKNYWGMKSLVRNEFLHQVIEIIQMNFIRIEMEKYKIILWKTLRNFRNLYEIKKEWNSKFKILKEVWDIFRNYQVKSLKFMI